MKKYIIAILLIILLSAHASADTIMSDILEYKETKLSTFNGNLTLAPYSTPTGTYDVEILFRLYDPVSNITVYCLKSNEIVYNSEFINDTKYYGFLGSDGNEYNIGVNYTIIQVPPGIDEIIAAYDARINELEYNGTILFADLIKARDALNASLDENTALSLEIENLNSIIAPLQGEIENQSELLDEYALEFVNLEDKLSKTEGKLNEYKDGFALFTSDGFYFNGASSIITIIIIFVLLFLYFNRKGNGYVPILSNTFKFAHKNKPKRKTVEDSQRDLEILKELKEG